MSGVDNLNYSNIVVVDSSKPNRKSRSKVGKFVGLTSVVAATAALDVPKSSYSKFFKGNLKDALKDFVRYSEVKEARIVKALGLKLPKSALAKSSIALAAEAVMFTGIYAIGYVAGAIAEKIAKKHSN